jgi:hypothetical protein
MDSSNFTKLSILSLRFFRLHYEGVFTTETWFENLTTLREIEGPSSQRVSSR